MGPDLEPRISAAAMPVLLVFSGWSPWYEATWTKCPELGIAGWDRYSGEASHLRSPASIDMERLGMRHHGRQKMTTATFVLRCGGFTMTATPSAGPEV